MCRVAQRYHKSPFDPEFLSQWENYEQRILLEASLEIDFDVDIVAETLAEKIPELMINLTDILGTSLVNLWAKKPIKHLINRDKDKDKEAIGNKIYLPNGQVINIGAKKE